MRFVVFGGAGFIGSHLVELLVERCDSVCVFDNFNSGLRLNLSAVESACEILVGDIRNRKAFEALRGTFDAAVHLAFPTPFCTRDRDSQFHDVCTLGTTNVLDWCTENAVRMVYGSSISVYGEQRGITIDESTAVRPVLPYAVNKLYGERMCASYAKMYGLQYDTIRISDVYGARDRRRNAVNSFIDAVLAGTPITIHGGGSQRRNFSLVTDIASGLRNVMAQPAGSATYILSDPLAMSVRELAEAVASLIDSEIEIISAGDPDTRDYVFDPSSFQQCFGQIDWTPLRAGLERCLVYRRRTR